MSTMILGQTHCVRCGNRYESWGHFDACKPAACTSFDRWHGQSCREQWPVSRWAWCSSCEAAV